MTAPISPLRRVVSRLARPQLQKPTGELRYPVVEIRELIIQAKEVCGPLGGEDQRADDEIRVLPQPQFGGRIMCYVQVRDALGSRVNKVALQSEQFAVRDGGQDRIREPALGPDLCHQAGSSFGAGGQPLFPAEQPPWFLVCSALPDEPHTGDCLLDILGQLAALGPVPSGSSSSTLIVRSVWSALFNRYTRDRARRVSLSMSGSRSHHASHVVSNTPRQSTSAAYDVVSESKHRRESLPD